MNDFLERFKQRNYDLLNNIKGSDPTFLEPAKKGYVCPFCGNGSGESGTGIVLDHNHYGKWTCFKCKSEGAGGSYDVLDLYGQATNIREYIAKVEGVASYYGWSVEKPSQTNESSPRNDFKGQGVQTMAETNSKPVMNAERVKRAISLEVKDYTAFYDECRANIDDPVAVKYLEKRGISLDIARIVGLGYCKNWKSPKALSNGYNPPATERLIIPCTKNHYVARAISDSVDKQYRKQNEVGNDRVGLFYYDEAVSGVSDYPVFITEGAIDAISVMEAGQVAVALNSTANVDLFIEKLTEKVKAGAVKATFILALDNDDSGRKATEVMKKELQCLNISYIVFDYGEFKSGKDLNEYLVADREGFINAVNKAVTSAGDMPDNTCDYLVNDLEAEIAEFKKSADVKTGFKKLDEMAHGIFAGLYCIAGGTSLGKTTLTLQLADQMAVGGSHVIVFSLEQSRLEMVTKSLARLTFEDNRQEAMNSLQIRYGVKKPILSKAIKKYTDTIGRRLSVVEGNFRCNISFIRDYVKRYIKNVGKTPIVIIDYLQILQPDKEGLEDTRVVIDNAVTELKRMSRDLKMTVFVISSINRANYLTPIDFEAMKGSGGIEYTADVVWGLQLACLNEDIFTKTEVTAKRERIKEAKSESPRKIELVCLKNRYGNVGWSTFFNYYPAHDVYVTDEWYIKPVKSATGAVKKR